MGAVTTEQRLASRRVALTLRPEILKRAEKKQRELAEETGIMPPLSQVLAVAAERGLTES